MTHPVRCLVLAFLLAVQTIFAAGAFGADATIDTVRDGLVGANNQLLDAAAQVGAGSLPDARVAVDQAIASLGQAATDVSDPAVQLALGKSAAALAKKLSAAQLLAAKAKAVVDVDPQRKSAKSVINTIRAAAVGVTKAALLVGRPLLVETRANTAGFHTAGQTVSFQIDLTNCTDTPVVTVTNAGTAPVVDPTSTVYNAATGVLTVRMGQAHGQARVEVTACGRTVRRLLYNYGVAAPRLRLTRPLPRAQVGRRYDEVAATAIGGVAPNYFSLETAGGFPPIGIILDINGRLTGTPSIPGTYTFEVCATDLSGSRTCGTATLIVDPPAFSIDDVTAAEGNSGTTDFTFTVTLSAASNRTASVKYVTSNGSASAGSDYAALPSTTLTFAAGETSKQVVVKVNGDTAIESAETFFVTLSSPSDALLDKKRKGIGTIVNDDVKRTAYDGRYRIGFYGRSICTVGNYSFAGSSYDYDSTGFLIWIEDGVVTGGSGSNLVGTLGSGGALEIVYAGKTFIGTIDTDGNSSGTWTENGGPEPNCVWTTSTWIGAPR